MTIVRTGATQKYASGWEQAFGKGGKTAKANGGTKTARKSNKKRKSGRGAN